MGPSNDASLAPPLSATTPGGAETHSHSTPTAGPTATAGRTFLHDAGRSNPAWQSIIWIGMLHVGALAAPWFFSWQGLVACLVLHWMTGGLGVCLGYHRYLTHAGFKTYKPVRFLLGLFGGLSGEGSAIEWVATHRKHHAHSDQHGDPHSPHDGGLWSHITWILWDHPAATIHQHESHWAPDLVRDPMMVFLRRTFLLWHFALAAVLAGVGYWMGGSYMATSMVVWGMFVRLCFVLHATWFVNSASHMWGYRNYETTDDSRNNWWVALITYGEGWHNNHHAYPRMAVHGHRWWEVDVTYMTIRLMRMMGLAWDVVDYKRAADKPASAGSHGKKRRGKRAQVARV